MTEYEELMVKHARSGRKREIINMFVTGFVGFCSVLVGFCSVFVGICSVRMARYGNEAAALQAMIAKNSEAPIFDITYTPPDKNNSKESSIKISVVNGKYSNLDTKIMTLFSLEFFEIDSDGHQTSSNKADLLVVNLPDLSRTGSLYETVATWSNPSASKLDLFRQKCVTHYTEKNPTRDISQPLPIQITIVTYLRLTYLNLLGDEETVYYCINPDSPMQPVQIVPEQGEEIFQKEEAMLDNGLFVDLENNKKPTTEAEVFDMVDAIKKKQEEDLYKGRDA